MTPSNNGNGRAANGRFAPGWKGGPGGNPFAAAALKLRTRLYEAITEDDVTAAVVVLREGMKSEAFTDRLAAAKEVLNRSCGKAEQLVTADVLTAAADAGHVDLSFATDEELARLAGVAGVLSERAKCDQCGKGRPCEIHK